MKNRRKPRGIFNPKMKKETADITQILTKLFLLLLSILPDLINFTLLR